MSHSSSENGITPAGKLGKADIVGQILMKPRPRAINSLASNGSEPAENVDKPPSHSNSRSAGKPHNRSRASGNVQTINIVSGAAKSPRKGRNDSSTKQFFAARLLRTNRDEHSRQLKLKEEELRLKQTELEMLSTAYTVAEVKKDETKANTALVKQRLTEMQNEGRLIMGAIRQLQNARNGYAESSKSVKVLKQKLSWTTEKELNSRIADLERMISEGKVNLQEEKRIVRELRDLEASRANVRKLQAAQKSHADVQGQLIAIDGSISDRRKELELINGQIEVHKKALVKLKEEADPLHVKLKSLFRDRCLAQQEIRVLKSQIHEQKKAFGERERHWFQNRRDIQALRKLVTAQNYEEAQALASAITEGVMARLKNDTLRKEYVQVSFQRNPSRFTEVMGPWGSRLNGMDQPCDDEDQRHLNNMTEALDDAQAIVTRMKLMEDSLKGTLPVAERPPDKVDADTARLNEPAMAEDGSPSTVHPASDPATEEQPVGCGTQPTGRRIVHENARTEPKHPARLTSSSASPASSRPPHPPERQGQTASRKSLMRKSAIEAKESCLEEDIETREGRQVTSVANVAVSGNMPLDSMFVSSMKLEHGFQGPRSNSIPDLDCHELAFYDRLVS